MVKKASVALLAICLVLMFSSRAAVHSGKIHYEGKVLVLMYHDIARQFHPKKPRDTTLLVPDFERHLQMLRQQDYRVITMEQFDKFVSGSGTVPANAVLLTFDDGYESFYTEAYPLLDKYKMQASNFIIGNSSDMFNPDAFPHLTWDEMRDLKRNGYGIYNHTYNLHRFQPVDKAGKQDAALSSRLYLQENDRPENEAEFRKRISSDIAFMEKRLQQELGAQPGYLCFPFGYYNQTVIDESEALGIRYFFTTEAGINGPGDKLVKRLNAGNPAITADILQADMAKYDESAVPPA